MGRKKNMNAVEKIDIRLRVDEPFRDRIQAAAEAEQTTVAGFIRMAVLDRLKAFEREAQAVREAERVSEPKGRTKGKPK